ncbi:hypothetical protein Tco_0156255 [Tanacetum coccineum]
MRDENHIRTLGDYSKPSHEGYKIPLSSRRYNVVPLRSDTIRLVQNGCSFHKLRSEDPNQHLKEKDIKDFLKLVDSLDLDSENRERTRLPFKQSIKPLKDWLSTSWHLQDARIIQFEVRLQTNSKREDDGEVMFIEIIQDDDEPRKKGPNEGEGATSDGSPAVSIL